ncbi:MAG: tRNA 2-thiouridine(34) synthase MnmA [Gammaproteobacteria bacterium TMED1]|nr:MAG: tRNA 2-thiouridine(34) synthase MnmA [Gammaproteobacteria bacterium TMED1]|tara:strand:- start:381 stop:1469 length:1089 start_codon:yes stop_codon:yes gene_type:complete
MKQSFDSSRNRVIVGLSGGVDSAVAAMLLKQHGYNVEGLFMKNWDEDDNEEYCTAQKDLEDAKSIAKQLDIPLHQANFSAEYWDNVFENFLMEYEAGRTPNPDVLCNREIKFKVFQDYAKSLGANYIATGHYARLVKSGNEIRLLKADDRKKDQTYFLQAVNASQLRNVLFPLGSISKDRVRELAKENKLKNHSKKDSTGICFIGERRFRDFLKNYLPAQPGLIEDSSGNILGKHEGLMFHTIGQRQGLRIGGIRGSKDAPWYVLKKDIIRNVLIVGQGNDHQDMYTSFAFCKDIYWIGTVPTLPFSGSAKIRYRQKDQKCSLMACKSGFQVKFGTPQRAVTPGQWICFYDQDWCLGGGIIE